ncbi:MAG: hypothetical protein R2873_18330 [Caldilineaceae bacterium]
MIQMHAKDDAIAQQRRVAQLIEQVGADGGGPYIETHQQRLSTASGPQRAVPRHDRPGTAIWRKPSSI